MTMKKRTAPSRVEPVRLDGVRYERMGSGKGRGLGQNGGYVAAIDERSGEELWIQKIYDVQYVGDMEQDKQDVYITGLSLDPSRRALLVKNERGERFALDLDHRSVEPA